MHISIKFCLDFFITSRSFMLFLLDFSIFSFRLHFSIFRCVSHFSIFRFVAVVIYGFSTNKTNRHDMAEILLKVALFTHSQGCTKLLLIEKRILPGIIVVDKCLFCLF
jgi:hypothetical protein